MLIFKFINLLEGKYTHQTIQFIFTMIGNMVFLIKLSPKTYFEDIIAFVFKKNVSNEKFAWQTGYSSFSISINKVGIVKKYILNQKENHKKDFVYR